MTIAQLQDLLAPVAYRDWSFFVGADAGGRRYLQVRFNKACSVTGKSCEQHGRKWWLSAHMTRSEVVATALKAVLTAEEHEAREAFRYRGEAIFGPHHDVEALVDMCRAGRQERRP